MRKQYKNLTYTDRQIIEYMNAKKISPKEIAKETGVGSLWTVSKVWDEGGGDYFILNYPDIPLSGLTVRVRG